MCDDADPQQCIYSIVRSWDIRKVIVNYESTRFLSRRARR